MVQSYVFWTDHLESTHPFDGYSPLAYNVLDVDKVPPTACVLYQQTAAQIDHTMAAKPQAIQPSVK